VTERPSGGGLHGWVVVAMLFFALALTFTARSSVGVLMPVWEQELGWGRTLISSGSSLVLAMMALSSPLAGNLMDRYGPSPVFAVGLALLGGAIIATSAVREEWQFLVVFGLAGGLGFGAVSLPLVSTAVAVYFTRNRGLASGIAMSGSTGGQLPTLLLLGILVTSIGWRGAYITFGLLLIFLAPVSLALIRRRSNAQPDRKSDIPDVAPAQMSLLEKLKFLCRDRTFLLLIGAFTLCGFTTAGVIDVHFIPYAVSVGYPLVDSTAAYGVHGLFNLIGLLLAGFLADHLRRPRLLSLIYVIRALSFILLLYISVDIKLMYLFAAIFGLLNFSVLPLVASLVATNIGVRIMGLTMGLVFAGHSIGGAIGAFLGGYFYDLFGDYELLWMLSAGLSAAAAVFSILIVETRGRAGAIPSATVPA
jgi:MFS family permease